MAYIKGNRHITDEQFSEGTTIDGSRVDKAIEDIIDHQNDIPIASMEAQWMPTTYVMSWSPSRPYFRSIYPNVINGTGRYTPDQTYGVQANWFPFLAVRNWEDEVYPVSTGQPPLGFNNEWRQKGFFHNPPENLFYEKQSRTAMVGTIVETANDVNAVTNRSLRTYAARLGGPITEGNKNSIYNQKHFAATFPLFFEKPVIIMDVSVFGAQEHPVSFFNVADLTATFPATPFAQVQNTGYKNNVFGPNQYDYSSDPCLLSNTAIETTTGDNLDPAGAGHQLAQTGIEYPGEKWTTSQKNFGNGTIEITIDNKFRTEQRSLDNIIFHKYDMGAESQRFNRVHNTTSTAAHARPLSGGQYEDMSPEYKGGPTWGVWTKEQDLNIPVPQKSRVRFSVITEGYRSSQTFEWHIALTVLELVEK